MPEFLHVDDLASAVFFAALNPLEENLYNVVTGKDIIIIDLAKSIQGIVGYQGEIIWDTDKPDGTPRKFMSVDKLKEQGWQYSIELEEGIRETYDWFLSHHNFFKQVKI